MKSILLAVVLVSVLIGNGSCQGIGNMLARTYDVFAEFPLSMQNASNMGWVQNGACDSTVGIAFVADSGAPSKLEPITLFYTAEGQISGLGMTHFGNPAAGLEEYWIPQNDGTFMMMVGFRDYSVDLCSDYQFEEILGTQLVINPQGIQMSLPLNDSSAQEEDWTAGGCITKMGTHWSYDLATAPNMSWNVSTLLPVVTMYNNGALSAFFFETSHVQLGTEPLGPWEGPIPENLMCLNWCSDSCSFDVLAFSTLHFFVTDPYDNSCPQRCSSM